MPATLEKAKSVLPTMYSYKGQIIPSGLTLAQRQVYLQGIGLNHNAAAFHALVDRSSSMASLLSILIKQTGSKELQEKADQIISQYNRELDEFVRAP